MAKPVIVAVNGICCEAGLDWVTTGDIVIASDQATYLFDPHRLDRAGRRPGDGADWRGVLPRSVALRMSDHGQAMNG